MTTRDLTSVATAILSLAPAARTASANGSTVDVQSYNAAMALVTFGAYTDGTHTPSLEHSDNGSTWTAVAAADLNGSFTAVSAVGGANTIQRVGYQGVKRYLRVVMTCSGTTTGAVSSGHIIVGASTQDISL